MLDFLSPLMGWLGIGGGAIAIALAVAWFFPPFRTIAIQVAGAIGGLLFIYGKGYRDAARRKQEEWDYAERDTEKRGREARRDSERDVARGLPGTDKYNRD